VDSDFITLKPYYCPKAKYRTCEAKAIFDLESKLIRVLCSGPFCPELYDKEIQTISLAPEEPCNPLKGILALTEANRRHLRKTVWGEEEEQQSPSCRIDGTCET